MYSSDVGHVFFLNVFWCKHPPLQNVRALKYCPKWKVLESLWKAEHRRNLVTWGTAKWSPHPKASIRGGDACADGAPLYRIWWRLTSRKDSNTVQQLESSSQYHPICNICRDIMGYYNMILLQSTLETPFKALANARLFRISSSTSFWVTWWRSSKSSKSSKSPDVQHIPWEISIPRKDEKGTYDITWHILTYDISIQ